MKIFNMDCLSLMKSDAFREMITDRKVCIVTDPPFNVGYHYDKYKDNMKEEDYYNFLNEILTMYDFPFVVIHYPEQLYKLAFKVNKTPTKIVSWVYNSNTAKQHRDIGFFGIKPDFSKVRQPYKNPNDKRIAERIKRGITGGRLYDWWEINQVKNVSKNKWGGINHPCVMPLEVMNRVIGILPNDYIIFDPFLGSGTTAIACHKNNREFIGCEIDKDYFDICIRRTKCN